MKSRVSSMLPSSPAAFYVSRLNTVILATLEQGEQGGELWRTSWQGKQSHPETWFPRREDRNRRAQSLSPSVCGLGRAGGWCLMLPSSRSDVPSPRSNSSSWPTGSSTSAACGAKSSSSSLPRARPALARAVRRSCQLFHRIRLSPGAVD
jgi:hypothetical protein